MGLTLLIGTGLAIISSVSYHSADPSLNTTASLPSVKNYLGYFGAVFADLTIQFLGYTSILCFFIMGCWGWKLWHHPLFSIQMRRILFGVLGIIGFGIFLNGWFYLEKVGITQPLYPGGALSYLFLKFFYRGLYNYLGLHSFNILIGFLGTLSLVFTWYSAGLSWVQFRKVFSFILITFQKIGYFYHCYVAEWMPFSFRKKHKTLAPWVKDLNFVEPNLVKNPEPSDISYEAFPQDAEAFAEKDIEQDDHSQEIPVSHKEASSLKRKNPPVSAEEILANYGAMDEYQLPTLELLDHAVLKSVKTFSQEALQESAEQLLSVLEEFSIRGEIVNIRPGPVVTMYELKPAPGIKTARVIGLADDIARSMSALSARIAVIPGQNVIGIELPNSYRQTVYLRELLSSPEYNNLDKGLPLILGKDISGRPSIADLTKMPHLLVAGTTGSGKSVSVNTMILSLLYKLTPDECKFIMIDPKMLELSIYDDIPHLLSPVVTDAKKAVIALKWAVKEMENRYRFMSKLSVRNIDGFNARLKEAGSKGELLIRRVQTGFDPDSGKPIFENQTLDFKPLPYIVIVVDEMADLMLVAGKEIEATVQRLAQMARAAGIHLIMATQRPSVDVITGTIKANFPTRMSFQVTSKIDSRTILGEQGAEQLLGQGDMLFMAGGGRISRVHGPFVSDEEVERIVKFLKLQKEPDYIESVTEDEDQTFESSEDPKSNGNDLYRQALDLVLREKKVSTSFIQRHLQIGYNRAARIVDQMEKEGMISAANHVGKREILKG